VSVKVSPGRRRMREEPDVECLVGHDAEERQIPKRPEEP
jgi:hypothetical protein